MDNGEINGFGTHEELLRTNAIYQDVYNSQIKGGGDFDENKGGDAAEISTRTREVTHYEQRSKETGNTN